MFVPSISQDKIPVKSDELPDSLGAFKISLKDKNFCHSFAVGAVAIGSPDDTTAAKHHEPFRLVAKNYLALSREVPRDTGGGFWLAFVGDGQVRTQLLLAGFFPVAAPDIIIVGLPSWLLPANTTRFIRSEFH